jgi:hypothetical protein
MCVCVCVFVVIFIFAFIRLFSPSFSRFAHIWRSGVKSKALLLKTICNLFQIIKYIYMFVGNRDVCCFVSHAHTQTHFKT